MPLAYRFRDFFIDLIRTLKKLSEKHALHYTHFNWQDWDNS